jgi:ribonucleotide reductase beta subunit family protein with ferritin-like domain
VKTAENSSEANYAVKPASASCADSSILFRQPADGQVEPGKPVLTIDDSRDDRLPAFSRLTFRDRYLRPGESSPQQAFARAALAYADDIAHPQRLYHYLSQGWFMQVTPMLTNAPQRRRFGDDWLSSFKRECFDQIHGMPISCYLSVGGTGTEQLIEHEGEAVRIVTQGGGIGGYWGATSPGGRASSGRMRRDETIPHLAVLDALMQASPQDDVRMAAYAAYLDINHPSIVEFLELRKASGGDANRKALYLHHGVNISDDFMQLIETCEHNAHADDAWPLIDPITGETVEVVSARRLWARLLEIAMETGEPFLLWTDTTNRALPTAQREAGLRIVQSNLCNEITLPTSTNRTGVATLSSVNLAHYSEWKDEPLFITDLVRMMLQSFAAMEAVHVDAYSLLLETVGMPESDYQAFKQYRAMADKHDFLAQFAMNDERDIARNLAVYAAFTEGLQLFSSFAILLNFARAELPRGARMKGMTQIVSWSVRDESLHVHYMLRLFRTFIGERPHLWTCALRDDLQDIGHTMVKLEDAFIDLAFEQGGIEGLDAAATKRYIRFIADRRLEGLMLAPRWGVVTNPLAFVDYLTAGPEHANFFETRPTEYAKAALTGSWSDVWGQYSH